MQHPLQLIWPASIDRVTDLVRLVDLVYLPNRADPPAPAVADHPFAATLKAVLAVQGEVATMVVQAIFSPAAAIVGIGTTAIDTIGDIAVVAA